MKNILKGIGSILNVWPNTDYERFLSKGTTAEERISSYWNRVCVLSGKSVERSNRIIKENEN